MVKVEAIVHPDAVERIGAALRELGVERVVYSRLWCHDESPAGTSYYRGCKCLLDIPAVKVEVLSSSLQVDDVVDAILESSRASGVETENIVSIFEVAEAVRVRQGRRAGLA